jgi:type VI protein secretion system component Hcp
MNHLFRILLVAACLGALPTIAAADTYLLVPGVAGDSTEASHKGWIRVASFDFAVKSSTTIGSATGGAGAGKASGETLKLAIPTGTWSRELVNTMVRGQHYTQLVIDHVNPDGRPSVRITLGTFFPTLYRNAPGAKTAAQDELEGVFASFRAEYYVVGADGRVSSTSAGWNLVTNTPL